MDAQANAIALLRPLAASRARAAGSQLRIYVLMDALGWPLVQAHRFLADLLPEQRPLRTVLGYSSGAIPTILTGEPPARHGHWNLLYYDPQGSPFRWLRRLGALAQGLDHRAGRYLLTRLGRHVLGLGPSFECVLPPHLLAFFNWAERRHLYRPGSVAARPTAFDLWREAGVRTRILSYRQGSDWTLLARAERGVARGEADVFFIYLSELDRFLHQHRSDPRAIAGRLAIYGDKLKRLNASARRRDPEMRMRVFSDHGMAPVRERVALAAGLRRLRSRMPQDYLAVLDSTMARFWFASPAARHEVEDHLGGLQCGRIVPNSELARLGVWFDDSRYGELIFLLHPGVIVAEGEFNGRGWAPLGMHGYHPDDPDSDAVLLSNEPADCECASIADLFACLCEPLEYAGGAPAGGRH